MKKTGYVLRQIAGKKLPQEKIVFREKDLFAGLSNDLNDMIDSLRQDRQVYDNAGEKLESLGNDIAGGNLDQKLCLTKIDNIINLIKR